MTERPLVSIVTPTLNQGRFIEGTIRSIRNQTYDNLEHIVVDGGSTDETLDILRRAEGTYNLRWLSEPDRGMYDAINKGMRLASGEILAYLNSDDLYFPWTLQVVVDHFERHPEADLVFGDALGIHDGSRIEDIRFQPDLGYGFLLRAGSFVQPGVFWRATIKDAVGEFDQSLGLAGDLDFWLRIGPGRRYARVEEILAIERDHDDTKRSSQWARLMSESRTARARVDRAGPARKRLGLVTGRFRAWWARRVFWVRFALRSTSRVKGRGPWSRFLSASSVAISWPRFVVSQLPWIGRRVVGGSIHTSVDWLAAGVPKADPVPGQGHGALRSLEQDWEDLATVDPLWAILSDPDRRGGGWDLAEFMATGESEIEAVMRKAQAMGYPKSLDRALDFGCGVGRLTRAMAVRFGEAVGVDISASMVEQARVVNESVENCSFRVNVVDNLAIFDDASFDLIYSNIVLQHVPRADVVEAYVGEFVRLLRPGGLLVFQLPARIPLRYQLQPRRRLHQLLRSLGVPSGTLQRRLGLHPISMTAVPQNRVERWLGERGATLLDVEHSNIAGFEIDSRVYWATRG